MAITPPVSLLGRLLGEGHFVVTAEVNSPDSGRASDLLTRTEVMRGHADAFNCTDNTGAHPHLAALAAAHLLAERGLEPIMQMTSRDRNRLAVQADLLGASALGVPNVVLMSGDDVSAGDHPETRSIFDLDSIQLVRVARILRDQGTYLSGRRLQSPPSYLVGAVENPFAPPLDFRPLRVAKKVEAGAEFIQTQLVFDLDVFAQFMARLVDLGLAEKVAVIASVGIVRSLRAARFMKEKVPGLSIPDAVIQRLASVPEDKQAAEGVRLAVETVAALRSLTGVRGVHLIAIRWEEGVCRVAEDAGLLPRPAVSALSSAGGA